MRKIRFFVSAALLSIFSPCALGVAHTLAAGDRQVYSLYSKGELPTLGVPETVARINGMADPIVFNVSEPTLEVFRPGKNHANGTAVIVAPGGGFVGIDYQQGGVDIARALAERGYTALVLKYRTIRSPDTGMHMPATHLREMQAITKRAKEASTEPVPPFAGEAHALEDAQRAIFLVKAHARDWGIDPVRIGFLGFSTGAFLAVDLSIGAKETRPAFVGILYGGLRGPIPSDASPAFIAAASDDPLLPMDAVQIYTAWRRAGVDAELHIYGHGGHGFSLAPQGTTSDYWLDEFIWWLKARKLE